MVSCSNIREYAIPIGIGLGISAIVSERFNDTWAPVGLFSVNFSLPSVNHHHHHWEDRCRPQINHWNDNKPFQTIDWFTDNSLESLHSLVNISLTIALFKEAEPASLFLIYTMNFCGPWMSSVSICFLSAFIVVSAICRQGGLRGAVSWAVIGQTVPHKLPGVIYSFRVSLYYPFCIIRPAMQITPTPFIAVPSSQLITTLSPVFAGLHHEACLLEYRKNYQKARSATSSDVIQDRLKPCWVFHVTLPFNFTGLLFMLGSVLSMIRMSVMEKISILNGVWKLNMII